MKKAITLSICMLVTITSLAASLEHNATSYFYESVNKETTLTLNNVKEGENLSIKDGNDFVLYKKELKNSGSTKHTFDFTSLPNGTYYFEHEKDYIIKIIPFQVTFGDVTFDTPEKLIFKPVIRIKDNNIYFSKLNLEKEDVNVALYYLENGQEEYALVHTDEFSDTLNLERVYGLSKEKSGHYKMIVKANERDYIEYFSI